MSESDAPTADTALPEPETTASAPVAAETVVTSEPISDTALPEPETTASAPEDATPSAPVLPTPSLVKPSSIKPSAIKPSALRPGSPGPRPAPKSVVAPPPAPDPEAIAAAEAFGRVADDGTVFVREAAGERVVGQVPGQSDSAAMSLYVRRYLDLLGKIDLFEARLGAADLSAKEVDQTIGKLRAETAEPAAVGDLDRLRARVGELETRAAEKRAQDDARRALAKAEALATRTAIVERVEKLGAADPATVQWRSAGEELAKLLDQWKTAQRSGPRIDRHAEDALWKRFSAARTVFDRERRKYFADLDQKNAEAKRAKEALIADAEKLATSTDWGPTAASFRDLMDKWKKAGRASRKEDDALWARFRGAQDKFFAAREAANAEVDAEYEKNLAVKEELLKEAEALVPVQDLNATKARLRIVQEKWETAGKVPRAAMAKVEARMRAVEQAVRDAEQAQWARSNPETRARAEGMAAQLEAAIASLEADLAAAEAKGDEKKIAEAQSALAGRKSLLETVLKAAQDSTA